MRKNPGFRSWFYFRIGWSTYFAFIFAAINTLTVTYFLAIERFPFLNDLFPSFPHYILVICSIGIPLLLGTGYAHYKRTSARKAEVDIAYETDPYKARTMVNTEISLRVNLELIGLLVKLMNNEKLSSDETEKISLLQKRYSEFNQKRTFKNKMDLDFLVNADKKTSFEVD